MLKIFFPVWTFNIPDATSSKFSKLDYFNVTEPSPKTRKDNYVTFIVIPILDIDQKLTLKRITK